MNVIKLDCDSEVLSAVDSPAIYSGDKNTVEVEFSFSSEWNNLSKTAIFYKDKSNVFSMLLDEQNKAIVPHEVMNSKGIFYLGLVGASGNDILTSSVVRYRVGEGAISKETTVTDPTPSIYEQILSEYNHAIDVAVTQHEEKIKEIQMATDECYSAISALQLEWMNYDGGYPNSEMNTSDDVNGGYPQTA